jgi:chromosome segregation ATPase
MTSLYQLTNEFQLLATKLNESDYDEQTIADTLEGASGDIETKATNVAMFIRNLESSAEAIKQAEKEMSDRRKAIEKKAESIRQYLKDNMQRCGITKIDSPYFALTLKKNPPSVIIDDAGAIAGELYVYPEAPAPYPDKKAISELLKAGKVVNGAHLEQAERLEIK